MRFSFPLVKSTKLDDGSLEVEGIFSTEELDKGGDIVPLEVTKKAVERWEAKNLREMHDDTRAVGKATEFTFDDTAGVARLKGFVSAAEPGTITKVLDGTLGYFSIAAPKTNFATEFVKLADGKRARKITSYDLAEISLVDNGMNASARVEFAKAVAVEEEPEEKSRFAAALLKAVAGTEASDTLVVAGESGAAPDDPLGSTEPAAFVLTAEQASALGIALDAETEITIGGVTRKAKVAAVTPAVVKRDFTADERKALAAKGEAMKDGGYPTPDIESFHDAVQALGRAGNPAAVKRYLRKRAKTQGWELPESLKGVAAATLALKKCCADVYVAPTTCYTCGCDCGGMYGSGPDVMGCDCSCCCGEAVDIQQAISALVSLEMLYAGEREEMLEGENETASLAALASAIAGLKSFILAEAQELLAESADETAEEEVARVVMLKGVTSGAAIGRYLARMEKRLAPMQTITAPPFSDADIARVALALTKHAGGLSAEDGEALGSGLTAIKEGVLKAVAEVERKLGAVGETVNKIAATPQGYIPGRNGEALAKSADAAPEPDVDRIRHQMATLDPNMPVNVYLRRELAFAEARAKR